MRLKTLLTTVLYLCLALVAINLVLLSLGAVSAEGLSEGYITTDSGLRAGMAVALSLENTSSTPMVQRASDSNPQRIIGIATGVNDSFIVISPGKQQIYVQSSGDVDAYVSDIDGDVSRGDLLTISPLNGILMKANSSSTEILGSALENLTDFNSQTYTIKTNTGTKQVHAAQIEVNLDNLGIANQTQPASALTIIGKALTGREIGDLRVLIALLIFLILLIAEGGIIYGAVSSSIAAIGRNPLAHKVIRGELVKVLLVVIFVLIIGLGSIYAVLWV